MERTFYKHVCHMHNVTLNLYAYNLQLNKTCNGMYYTLKKVASIACVRIEDLIDVHNNLFILRTYCNYYYLRTC